MSKPPKKRMAPEALARLRATLDSRETEQRLCQCITPASPLAWRNQLHSTWLTPPKNEREHRG